MSQLSSFFPPEFPFFHQAPVKQPFTTIEQQYHLKIAYLARFYSSLLLKCWLSIHLQGNKNSVMSVKDWRQHLARVVVVVVFVTNLGDTSETCQYITEGWCGKLFTFLQRFLNIYSERIVAWDPSTALSRCAARTGGDRSRRLSEHPVRRETIMAVSQAFCQPQPAAVDVGRSPM